VEAGAVPHSAPPAYDVASHPTGDSAVSPANGNPGASPGHYEIGSANLTAEQREAQQQREIDAQNASQQRGIENHSSGFAGASDTPIIPQQTVHNNSQAIHGFDSYGQPSGGHLDGSNAVPGQPIPQQDGAYAPNPGMKSEGANGGPLAGQV
jgi:hypothetical protein